MLSDRGYGAALLAVSKAGTGSRPWSGSQAERNRTAAWACSLGSACSGASNLPLLKGPMLVGSLLVFVDVVKELPLTLLAAPSTSTPWRCGCQYASDETGGGGHGPCADDMVLRLGRTVHGRCEPGKPQTRTAKRQPSSGPNSQLRIRRDCRQGSPTPEPCENGLPRHSLPLITHFVRTSLDSKRLTIRSRATLEAPIDGYISQEPQDDRSATYLHAPPVTAAATVMERFFVDPLAPSPTTGGCPPMTRGIPGDA